MRKQTGIPYTSYISSAVDPYTGQCRLQSISVIQNVLLSKLEVFLNKTCSIQEELQDLKLWHLVLKFLRKIMWSVFSCMGKK